MPAPNSAPKSAAGRGRPADIAGQLAALDPERDYSFIIRPARNRSEIVDELTRMFAAQEPDPAVADLSDDELMERVDAEIAAARADRSDANR